MALKPKPNLIAETQLHRCDDGSFWLKQKRSGTRRGDVTMYSLPASVSLCVNCVSSSNFAH